MSDTVTGLDEVEFIHNSIPDGERLSVEEEEEEIRNDERLHILYNIIDERNSKLFGQAIVFNEIRKRFYDKNEL
jgi:hypothetical protein